AKRLTLTESMALSNVSLDVALGAGRLELRKLEGAGLGGRLSAGVQIEKGPGGAEVSGSVRLANATLAGIVAETGVQGRIEARTGGTLAGEITFAGRGSSPRNVVSVLTGAGTVRLGAGKLPTLWPGAIGIAADAAL